MALAEALLKATHERLTTDHAMAEAATWEAWDELWTRANEDDATEGDIQELAEAYGLARLHEERVWISADAAHREWVKAAREERRAARP